MEACGFGAAHVYEVTHSIALARAGRRSGSAATLRRALLRGRRLPLEPVRIPEPHARDVDDLVRAADEVARRVEDRAEQGHVESLDPPHFEQPCGVHVRQCERWGPLFIPAYLVASAVLWCRGRDFYEENPFEREAYAACP